MPYLWTEAQPAGAVTRRWKSTAVSTSGQYIAVIAEDVSGTGGRLYHSATYGASWSEMRPAGDVSKDWEFIAMSGDGATLLCGVGGGRLYLGANYGASWAETQPGGAVNYTWRVGAIDEDGSHILAGGNGGYLYLSTDGGSSWPEITPAGAGYKAWYTGAMDSDGSHIIAGIYPGRLYLSVSGGSSWSQIQPAGDANKNWRCAAMDSDGSHMLVAVYGGRLYLSNDSGAGWSEVQPAGDANKNWALLSTDGDGSHMLAGIYSARLYLSNNSGSTWPEVQPAGAVNYYWYGQGAKAMSGDAGYICVSGDEASNGRIYLGTYWEPLPTDFVGTSELEATMHVVHFAPQVSETIWTWPMRERLKFNTEILQSHNRTEQRIAHHGGIPRQEMATVVTVVGDPEVARFENILHRWMKMSWPVPLWPQAEEHTATLASGSSSISIDTQYAEFRAGSYAMIWQPTQYEIIEVSDVASDSLTLYHPTRNTFTGQKWIIPCRLGWHPRMSDQKKYPGAAMVEMAFAVDPGDLAAVTGFSATLTYDSMTVLTEASYADGDSLPIIRDPDVAILDGGTGIFEIVSNSPFNEERQTHVFAYDTKAECWWLRQFLHNLKGRQGAFLVPTFFPDFVLSRSCGSGDTSIYVANRGYANMGTSRLYNYLAFMPTGSQIIPRSISAISAVSATEEQIDIASGPGQEFAAGSELCWVHKCRLAHDEINFEWSMHGQLTCATEFTRLP